MDRSAQVLDEQFRMLVKQKHAERLLQLQQAAAEQAPRAEAIEYLTLGAEAAAQIDLDEAATRERIDQQLRDRGWEADTKKIRFSEGVRPAKGHNMAIAEWPT